MRNRLRQIFGILLTASAITAQAAQPQTYIMSSPPRGTAKTETATYAPIASMLSRATGARIVYEFPGDWLTYTHNMRSGAYDLLFDGPHFVSWRVDHQHAIPIAKLPQPHIWVLLEKTSNTRVTTLENLAGRTVCAPPPPNFGALVLQSLFPDPLSQPVFVPTKSWKDGYEGVAHGQCVAAIVPLTTYHIMDPDGTHEKILFQHAPYPNQAWTASARMPAELVTRITQALLSPAGQQVLKPLRERFAHGRRFVPAEASEYAGIDQILKGTYGF